MAGSIKRANISLAGALVALAYFILSPIYAQDSLFVDKPVYVPHGQVKVLEIPSDGLSPSDIENIETIEIDEIILERDAQIIIPPFKSVIIQNLVAEEGAKVQLAHSDSGGEGANARFFIKKIKGHVVIESRGGDGRDGRDGRHGRQGRDGEDGRDARTLIFGLIWLGDGETGRPGYPGEDGEDGEDGQDGGLGGRITLYYVEKTDESKIFVDVSGGRAGNPGKPGLGGLGGNGGAGGDGWKDGRQGPMGPRGQAGQPGRPGRPGMPGHAAIYQLNERLYRCLMILDARSSVETLSDDDFDTCRETNETIPSLSVATIKKVPIVQSTSDYNVSDVDGLLLISADGMHGRSARDARLAGASAETASSGANGGAMTIFIKDLPARARLTSRGGRGGNGGNGARGLRGGDGRDGRHGGLFRKAQPGENGASGTHGGNGSDGGHGGSGGYIRVVYIVSDAQTYDASWTSRFDVDVSGGIGGDFGVGAEGGEGGLAGRGGKKFLSSKRAADGYPGVKGKHGRDGRNGAHGDDGHIEFFEASSTTDWIIEEFKAELERQ